MLVGVCVCVSVIIKSSKAAHARTSALFVLLFHLTVFVFAHTQIIAFCLFKNYLINGPFLRLNTLVRLALD